MTDSRSDSALPDALVQAISIANATSLGTQPALLANLALANQIFNTSLQQQAALSTQQAVNLVTLAIVARCANLVASDLASDPNSASTAQLQELLALLKSHQPPASPATAPAPAKS